MALNFNHVENNSGRSAGRLQRVAGYIQEVIINIGSPAAVAKESLTGLPGIGYYNTVSPLQSTPVLELQVMGQQGGLDAASFRQEDANDAEAKFGAMFPGF